MPPDYAPRPVPWGYPARLLDRSIPHRARPQTWVVRATVVNVRLVGFLAVLVLPVLLLSTPQAHPMSVPVLFATALLLDCRHRPDRRRCPA